MQSSRQARDTGSRVHSVMTATEMKGGLLWLSNRPITAMVEPRTAGAVSEASRPAHQSRCVSCLSLGGYVRLASCMELLSLVGPLDDLAAP